VHIPARALLAGAVVYLMVLVSANMDAPLAAQSAPATQATPAPKPAPAPQSKPATQPAPSPQAPSPAGTFSYFYEPYRVFDFAFDPRVIDSIVQPRPLVMGYVYRPYTAHVVVVGIKYIW